MANERLTIAGRVVIPDVLFARSRVIVEVDGHQHHSNRQAFERVRARHNLLTSAGYRVLRFTWLQLVTDPEGVVRQILNEVTRAA